MANSQPSQANPRQPIILSSNASVSFESKFRVSRKRTVRRNNATIVHGTVPESVRRKTKIANPSLYQLSFGFSSDTPGDNAASRRKWSTQSYSQSFDVAANNPAFFCPVFQPARRVWKIHNPG